MLLHGKPMCFLLKKREKAIKNNKIKIFMLRLAMLIHDFISPRDRNIPYTELHSFQIFAATTSF